MVHPKVLCAKDLQERSQLGLARKRQHHEGVQANFAGNDYLGLSAHPEVIAAFSDGLRKWGAGSTGSPLVSGYQQPHEKLERTLAEWLDVDAVVLFSTGFAANSALMTLLCKYGYVPYLDKLSHASLFHGLGLFHSSKELRTPYKRFRHNDFEHLRQLMAKPLQGHELIVTEGVFSMDGDSPNFADLAKVMNKDQAIWVDDAHALGWKGSSGAGTTAQIRQRDHLFITGTFGKALGCHGAFIAGPTEWIEAIVNFAPEYIYSTAMPAAQAQGVLAAIELVKQDKANKDKLLSNIQMFLSQGASYGLPVGMHLSPIQPLIVQAILGEKLDPAREYAALSSLTQVLNAESYTCGLIRPPTVPIGTTRLRVSISAKHTEGEIDRLLQKIASWRDGFLKEPR